MTRYGYIRVSTDKQELHAQREKLLGAGVSPENLYEDFALSGTQTTEGEGYRELMEKAQAEGEGAVIVVTSLDRFGRSLISIVNEVDKLSRNGIAIHALRESIDTTDNNPQATFLLHIFGAFAQLERELISQRTKEALAYKKAQLAAEGKTLGRPSVMTDEKIRYARHLELQGWGSARIAREIGVSKPTILKALGRGGQ